MRKFETLAPTNNWEMLYLQNGDFSTTKVWSNPLYPFMCVA